MLVIFNKLILTNFYSFIIVIIGGGGGLVFNNNNNKVVIIVRFGRQMRVNAYMLLANEEDILSNCIFGGEKSW